MANYPCKVDCIDCFTEEFSSKKRGNSVKSCCPTFCHVEPCFIEDLNMVNDLIYQLRRFVSCRSIDHTTYLKFGYGVQGDDCYLKDHFAAKNMISFLSKYLDSLRKNLCYCLPSITIQGIIEKARNLVYSCGTFEREDIFKDTSYLDVFKSKSPECFYQKPWERLRECMCKGVGFDISSDLITCDIDYNVNIIVDSCQLELNDSTSTETCQIVYSTIVEEKFCDLVLDIKTSIDQCDVSFDYKSVSIEDCKLHYDSLIKKYDCNLSLKDYYKVIKKGQLTFDSISKIYSKGCSIKFNDKSELLVDYSDCSIELSGGGNFNIKNIV